MLQKISFSVDGQKIAGTLIYQEKKNTKHPAVMFIHGWMSSERGYIERAKPLADLGYICLTFNMRGHGDSEGKIGSFSRKDHLLDCMAAYDFLINRNEVDCDKIHIVGSSYGGYLASILSSRRNTSSLVLKAPALYPDADFDVPTMKLIRKDIKIYRQQNLKPENNYALSAIRSYNGKILLFECGKDSIAPKPTIRNYINSNSTNIKHTIIPDADHVLSKPAWNRFFIDKTVDWFEKMK